MSDSKKIQAAIIGCGVIGKTHKAAIEADGRVEIRWACDTDLQRAIDLAPDAKHAFDLAEVLLDDELDVVHICTPHAVHQGQLDAVVAAGKHVICEKPLATTPAQLHAMVDAGERNRAHGKVAACIFQHRYGALARRLHELLSAGAFGELTSATLPFRCKRTQAYYDSAEWRGTWLVEGGGTCINQAIHSIDLLQWLCGTPVRVSATTANVHLQDVIEVEDEAKATVTFASGLEATLDIANNQADDWLTRCDIAGTKGRVSFTQNGGGKLLELEHEDHAVVDELRAIEAAIAAKDETAAVGKACYGDLHHAQISDCYDAVLSGGQPFVTIADGAAACELVLGIYHSSATGAPADLPLADAYRQPQLVGAAAAKAS